MQIWNCPFLQFTPKTTQFLSSELLFGTILYIFIFISFYPWSWVVLIVCNECEFLMSLILCLGYITFPSILVESHSKALNKKSPKNKKNVYYREV